jgi:ABC-type nitrate/sulfonate/bicarbonate transport system ATPase subunit
MLIIIGQFHIFDIDYDANMQTVSLKLLNKRKEIMLDIPLDKYPYQCSGGQKQMTAIARALIIRPELLLMDEAFGSLDYNIRLQLQEKLLDIWKRIGNTILMVSHDVDQAAFLSDRIVILSKRPTRVFDVVEVDLPRPRELKSLVVSAAFQKIRGKVINSFLQGQQD